MVVGGGEWAPGAQRGLLKNHSSLLAPTLGSSRGWEGLQECLSVDAPNGLGREVAGVRGLKGIMTLQGMQCGGKTLCSSVALQKRLEQEEQGVLIPHPIPLSRTKT